MTPKSGGPGSRGEEPALSKPTRDLVFGLVVAGIAGAYSFQATRIPTNLLSDGVGAGGLPFLLGLLVASLGLVLAGRSAIVLARAKSTGSSEDDGLFSRAHLKGFLLFLVGVGYLLLVPVVGYLVGVFLLIATTAILAGLNPSLRNALTAAAIAMVLALIFVTLMHTAQPEGLLPLKIPMLRF